MAPQPQGERSRDGKTSIKVKTAQPVQDTSDVPCHVPTNHYSQTESVVG